MKKIIQETKLDDLGDQLLQEIKKPRDFFDTITVVVPSLKIAQWFKTYWLSKEEDVLANVNFIEIDEALLSLIDADIPYRLIRKEELKLLILKRLVDCQISSLPKDYFMLENGDFDAIKLNDFADVLTKLFLEYDIESFNITGWQKVLYELVMADAISQQTGTLRSIFEKSGRKTIRQNKKLHFFGFSSMMKIHEDILDEYQKSSDIDLYQLEKEREEKRKHPVYACPSRLREVENLHSEICKLLKVQGNQYSDFLVLAPQISAYETAIARVFKQDNVNFPNIPYAINDRLKTETDVTRGLDKLFEIARKGYCTRLDFTELFQNVTIQKTRTISQEDADAWKKAIIDTNTYRDHESCDDWDYIKKRVLLTKIASVNDGDESIVELCNEEMIPYASINLEDESIIRFVAMVDDLKNWRETVQKIKTINSVNIDETCKELDKWFSIKDKDGLENNCFYQKLMNLSAFWKTIGMPNDKIPLETFYYVLKDAGSQIKSKNGELFVRGITFADFDENAILSAKHVFFLDGGANIFPQNYIKSELDLRADPAADKLKKTENGFILQQQNAEDFTISYIDKNLKTDEDYELSSIITDYANVGSTTKIGIDENRDWSELFTDREHVRKKIADGMTHATPSNPIPDVQKEWYKKLKVKDMAEFLKEPLSGTAKLLFGWNDDVDEKTRDEFEPFEFDNITKSKIRNRIAANILKGIVEKDDDIVKELKRNRSIPTITKKYTEKAYKELKKESDELAKCVIENLGEKLEIIKPEDLVMDFSGHEWVLTCNTELCRKQEGNHLSYMELKMSKTDTRNDEYTPLINVYVMALMDVAARNEGDFNVTIHCQNVKNPSVSFSLSVDQAKAILNNIYERINEFPGLAYFPVKCLGATCRFDYGEVLDDSFSDYSSWKYYADKKLFGNEKLLGYTEAGFDEEYNNMLEQMKKMIIFAEEESEADE